MEVITIHEFSTGIKVDIQADESWISQGFTGQYMNNTLEVIPYNVERAIANKRFAVAEGMATNQPAVIGRVISGKSGNPDYSVIALVSRGKDDKARSLSVYRYFLCEGGDGLGKLLGYLQDFRNKRGKLPVFNPNQSRKVGKPIKYRCRGIETDLIGLELELQDNFPILLSPEPVPELLAIHQEAIRHADDQVVAWAYNVEALEEPWYFTIIHPASNKAYENLSKVISKPPVIRPSLDLDEQALKSAVKSLMNNSQVKPEAVKAIAVGLDEESVTQQYWMDLFNKQGAKDAIKQNIASEPMVRLLTLQSIVIAETLPNLLEWLTKHQDLETVFHDFQKSFSQHFPPNQRQLLKNRLGNGLQIVMEKLLAQEIGVKEVSSLLNHSPWLNYRQEILEDIKEDLQLIAKTRKHLNPDNLNWGYKIWKNLINSWGTKYDEPISYYQPLAELFKQLAEYRLASYFYQISDGKVPKSVWDNAGLDTRYKKKRFLGTTIYRQVTLDEIIIGFVGEYKYYIVLIPLISFSLVGMLYLSFNKTGRDIFFCSFPIKPFQDTSNQVESDISCSLLIHGVKEFETTRESIKAIIGEFKDKAKAKEELKTMLGGENPELLNFNAIDGDEEAEFSNKDIENWVKAIYEYQKSKNQNSNGIIELLGEDGQTTTRDSLESVLKDKLIFQSAIKEENFKQTSESLKQLIAGFGEEKKEEAKIKLKEILGDVSLPDLEPTINNERKKQWVKAIYGYQQKYPELSNDGVIHIDGETMNKLKGELNQDQDLSN